MTTKICSICGEEKPIENFYSRHSYCGKCGYEKSKSWRKINRIKNLEKFTIWRKNNSLRVWARTTLIAHKKKYTVELTLDELLLYIRDKSQCEMCGRTLSFKNEKIKNDSPSLDRINNESIITKNNIQLLCYECNRTKGSRTELEFLEYCKLILKRKGL